MDGLSVCTGTFEIRRRSHERRKSRIPYEFASIHVFLRTVRPGITAYSGTIEQPELSEGERKAPIAFLKTLLLGPSNNNTRDHDV